MKINNNKGITLIALVITIIVLLILAGIAISMISGENGILKQAARAKEQTDIGKIRETIRLAGSASFIDPSITLEKQEDILRTELDKLFEDYDLNGDSEDEWVVTVDGVTETIGKVGKTNGSGGSTTDPEDPENPGGTDPEDPDPEDPDQPGMTKYNLNIDVTFPNAIESQPMDYTAMTVTVKNALGDTKTMNLGNDSPDFEYLTASESGTGYVTYRLKAPMEMLANNRYYVTIEGLGYRKFNINFIAEQDTKVTLWNNAKTNPAQVIDWDTEKTYNTTFLAGEMVADGVINNYDQSLVTSWFGQDTSEIGGTAHKCDLNRDRKVDSKDVAIVTVAFGY